MSDVARYVAAGDGVVKTDPAGPLVKWNDYARLQAENEELHKDYEALADEHTKLIERLTNCQAEADRLKAEVERLRKAGDAMAHWVGEDTHFWWGQPEASVEAWNAAKEGKPSV